MYAVSTTGKFAVINTQTGASTDIADLIEGAAGDLDFNPVDGKLYMASINQNLVKIDPSTGQSSIVGSFGSRNFYGLAFTSGNLYGFDVYSRDIVTIDLTNANTTVAGTVPDAVSAPIRGASSPPLVP